MKILTIIVFAFSSLACMAQETKKDSVQAPVIVRDTIQVNLSPWQDQQIIMLDQQARDILEQQHIVDVAKKTIVRTIIESKGIDENKVENLQYLPGKLILIVTGQSPSTSSPYILVEKTKIKAKRK